MSMLIIGANGQLGKALQEKYSDATAVDAQELDITNEKDVSGYDWTGVSVIFNAAAYTNVDGAETPEGRRAAWQVNAVGVQNLTRIATQNNITLVHISTDYVFDGSIENHTEDEPFSPLSVYGASKAAGDIAIGLAPQYYLLRTSWVIGEGKNFVRTMINLAGKDVSPTVVSDQIGRPTFTSTLVDAISHLLETNSAYGTYNVSNTGDPTSWADITRTIFDELGRDDLTVTDITTDEYYAGKPGIAPRPLQSTFDLSKIKATGVSLRDWRDDLKTYIKKELQQ